MNKKLFSWKALAGLALLVAMGLTSCKQGTEVDPNDPYNTTKPVTPGASTSGSADLTLTLAVPSDFASLWKNSVKDDVKKALAKKDEITVLVKTGGMKVVKVYKSDNKTVDAAATATQNTITLPDFFNGKTGKIANIVMDGTFASIDNVELKIDSKNLASDVVDVKFPGNSDDKVYSLNIDAGTSLPVIGSTADAYIDRLTVSSGQNLAKECLVVASNINIARIDENSNWVNVNGGNIAAIETANTQNTGWGNLFTNEDVYVANLGWRLNKSYNNGYLIPGKQQVYGVWATADIDVYAMSQKRAADILVIEEGKTVTLIGSGATDYATYNGAPYVKKIVGLGDNGGKLTLTTGAENYNNYWVNWRGGFSTHLTNTESVKNVTITSGLTIESDIYDNVTVQGDGYITKNVDAVDGLTFESDVYVAAPSANYNFAFNGINFKTANAGKVQAYVDSTNSIIDADDEIATVVTYKFYNFTTNAWDEVDSFADVPAANKKLDAEGATVTSWTAWMEGDVKKAHLWYKYVEYLEETIDKYTIVLDFSNCKVDDKALSANNLTKILKAPTKKSEVSGANMVKYKVGETLYKWAWTSTGVAKLVSTKE